MSDERLSREQTQMHVAALTGIAEHIRKCREAGAGLQYPNLQGDADVIEAAAKHMDALSRPEGASAPQPDAATAAQQPGDAERLDWLERFLFDKHWDGTIGRATYWRMAGPYRHELMKMRGHTLREAIDAARAAAAKGGER